ncbi:hypothetical protein BH11ARM2_BH11ARM2_38410 [soil metagenome]
MKAISLSIALAFGLAGCNSSGSDGPTPDAEFINAMSRKTGGDVSKLTPDERARMDKVTGNETETVLKMSATNSLPPVPVQK